MQEACTYYSKKGGDSLASSQEGVNIGTVSGGIVNFGGAVYISPISVTRSTTGAGGNNTGADVTTNTGLSTANQKSISDFWELIKTMLD